MKFLFLILILFANVALAYPEFIGYGYSSCLTCHVNGQGSGPLNDYGRALWSAEIASRWLYPSSWTDEDMGNQSGFLGKPDRLPYWFRPHLKTRELHMKRNFKGPSEASAFYRMQEDVGATFSDEAGKYVGVVTWGRVQETGNIERRLLAREYYVRLEPVETWWLYAGLLEKVFGIRNIDHSSYQRSPQGFNPTLNSRTGMANSQGVILHKIAETWEVAANYFIGNPHEQEEYRHKGFSLMGEYEVGELKRIGLSAFDGKSDLNKKNMYAFHYRQGLSKGSAFLFEYGYIESEDTDRPKTKGSYNLLQTNVLMTRGYSLKATVERYNSDFKATVPDSWKWGLGVVAFPLPRLELRAEVYNARAFYEGPVQDDNWSFLGQLHVSL